MLDPRTTCRSDQLSQVALVCALFLAGTFGLVASVVLPTKQARKALVQSEPVLTHPAVSLEKTTMAPVETPSSEAVETLTRFCSKHVTVLRSFVLFRNGTCVMIDEPCADPLAEATQRLTICANAGARFVSEFTSAGDIVVAFEEPVFHLFSTEEHGHPSAWLDQITPDLLTSAETTATESNPQLSLEAQAGLLARRKLLEDAADMVPVKIIRAKNRHTVAR